MILDLEIRLLKNICGDFIEDFLINNELIESNDQEFTIDLEKYSLMLLPYMVKWIHEGNNAVEIMLLKFENVFECISAMLNFIHISRFQINNKFTKQVAYVILTKDFKNIYNEFESFYLNIHKK